MEAPMETEKEIDKAGWSATVEAQMETEEDNR